MNLLRTCIVGSGNWGSAIARIVGSNTAKYPQVFQKEVTMWVFEEFVNGKKLSEIINEQHENVKYLPGKSLPNNVVANPDLADSVKNADILIFVVPHQFVKKICADAAPHVKPTAMGVSLIKGLALTVEHGELKLVSEAISDLLKIQCNVLMGANLAHEVAAENFCEATVGAKNPEHQSILKQLFQTEFFRISCVVDAHTVELCGALKNIVACGAGFADGLGYGDNTKAAIIRLGLMEMTYFVEYFYPGSQLATFFESCGIADVVTTCYGGRNRRVSEAFVKTGKDLTELESELLGGQRLQGPHTAEQVYKMMQAQNMQEKYPLFTAVHKICTKEIPPEKFIDCLRDHPEHRSHVL